MAKKKRKPPTYYILVTPYRSEQNYFVGPFNGWMEAQMAMEAAARKKDSLVSFGYGQRPTDETNAIRMFGPYTYTEARRLGLDRPPALGGFIPSDVDELNNMLG